MTMSYQMTLGAIKICSKFSGLLFLCSYGFGGIFLARLRVYIKAACDVQRDISFLTSFFKGKFSIWGMFLIKDFRSKHFRFYVCVFFSLGQFSVKMFQSFEKHQMPSSHSVQKKCKKSTSHTQLLGRFTCVMAEPQEVGMTQTGATIGICRTTIRVVCKVSWYPAVELGTEIKNGSDQTRVYSHFFLLSIKNFRRSCYFTAFDIKAFKQILYICIPLQGFLELER